MAINRWMTGPRVSCRKLTGTQPAPPRDFKGMAIVCKSQSEIDKMRRSGRIVRQILDDLRTMVAPGVTTMDLEKAAEPTIKESGATPPFNCYYYYPCVC